MLFRFFGAEAIGFNHVMRQAVINDRIFIMEIIVKGHRLIKVFCYARMLEMLAYRTDVQLAKAFGRATKSEGQFWGDPSKVGILFELSR